nr:MAG TPA: hypothetical protein [Caudoviricetes sp.]
MRHKRKSGQAFRPSVTGELVRIMEEWFRNFVSYQPIKTISNMSQITEGTRTRIDKWLSLGTPINSVFHKLDQRYRMQVCSEFYKRWVQNKDIDPRTTCRNIARRDYELFFNQAAQGNKEAQDMVLALRITLDDEGNIKPRTVTELNNDVSVCNYLIRFFMTDESPRHKAMYLSSAEWLIRTGKQQNNDRAVDKGMQALSNVYGNFQEEKDATDEMPDMSRIAITQDVSIVKRDRVNYTDEYKAKMARKYGLTRKDLQDMEEEASLNDMAKPDAEPDYFEYMEEQTEQEDAQHPHSTAAEAEMLMPNTHTDHESQQQGE